MVLLVDWIAFGILPNYVEGIGLAIVLLSATGLSVYDTIEHFMMNKT